VPKLRPIIRGGQTAKANLANVQRAALSRAFASTIAPAAQPLTTGGGAIQKVGEEFVRLYSTTSKGVPISANRRWDNPISYEETGYILGWLIAVNDPQMKVTFKIEGEDRTEIILHDHTMEETASLGLGMTYGEFYSMNPVGGGTSRDIRGSKHSTRPFLSRAKTTFTGTETNYDLIKGTVDDKWIVLQFDPELPRKYYALTLDVENTLGEGDRLIHEIFVDRMVVISQYATQVAHKQYAPRLVDSSLVETEKVKAYAGSLVNPLDEDAVGEPVEPSIDFSAGVPHLSPAPAEDLEEVEEEEEEEEEDEDKESEEE
jgi:hypothetical protein